MGEMRRSNRLSHEFCHLFRPYTSLYHDFTEWTGLPHVLANVIDKFILDQSPRVVPDGGEPVN